MTDLPPACDERIAELVDAAPPIPVEARDLIRRVFAGRIQPARRTA